MTRVIREMRLAGKPLRCAGSRIRSSLGASYTR